MISPSLFTTSGKASFILMAGGNLYAASLSRTRPCARSGTVGPLPGLRFVWREEDCGQQGIAPAANAVSEGIVLTTQNGPCGGTSGIGPSQEDRSSPSPCQTLLESCQLRLTMMIGDMGQELNITLTGLTVSVDTHLATSVSLLNLKI